METELSPQAMRILECARSLIAAGGYNGFSYADISADVGITKASIHHHFTKKSDLVRVLLQCYRAEARQGLAGLTAKIASPLARLRAYAAWWSTCIGDGSMPICICAMLSAEVPALPAEIATEIRLHFDHLANWLEGLMADGQAGKLIHLQDTPAAEAHAFMATVHGGMLSARACGDPTLFANVVGAALVRLTPPK